MYGVIRVETPGLQAACRWQEGLPPALGLVDPAATRGLVLEANAQARRHRVLPGVTAAQALARCPGIRLLARSPQQEAICQSLLIETAWTASPRVESTGQGVVTLDLRAVARGAGWLPLGQRLLRQLRGEGLEACIGFAPAIDFALLATRLGEEIIVMEDGAAFCAPLPIAVLEPSPALARILRDWGVATIGAFLRLPAQAVIERLGPEAALLRERATGRSRRVLECVAPVEIYREGMDLEHPVETTGPLLFLLRRFLDSLCARIGTAHRHVVALRLSLPLDGGGLYERDFTLPSPTLDAAVLFRVLDGHLETLRLEDCPVGIRLEAQVSEPQGKQLALLERGVRDPAGLGFTLARLQAIVGEGRVGTPQPAGTHQPGAMVLAPFSDEAAPEPVPIAYGLPLRRLRPPLAAQVRLYRGAPAWLAAPRWAGPIEAASGPYRFSGHWWEAAPWALEEWDVKVRHHGLLRLARRESAWSIEGTYDVC